MKGRNPTKAEAEWMESIREGGCIVCWLEMDVFSPCAVHHIKGKTKPGAHFMTLPLCYTHHQGGPYGIGLHNGKAQWQKRHGTEAKLLDITRKRLGFDTFMSGL